LIAACTAGRAGRVGGLRDDEEARGVVAAVLDAAGEDGDATGFGGGGRSHGRLPPGLAGDAFDRGRGALGLNKRGRGQVPGKPAAALGKGDVLRKHLLDLVERAMADEALLDREGHLRDDLQLGLRQQVERMADHAFGRILDRDDAVGRLAGFDGGEDVGDGAQRQGRHAGAEGADLSLLGEGALGPEVGDRVGHLGADRKRDDLAVHGAQAGGRDFGGGRGDGAQELLLALRGVDRRA